MAAGVYDITCEQGATLRKQFTWLDENEQPIDLTGCTARMQIRQSHKAPTTWASFTSADALSIVALTGTVVLTIAAAVTATLPVGKGVYDLEIVHPTGDVTRLLQGSFTVSPEVTR